MSNPATGENSAPIIKGSRILSEAFMADDKHIIPRQTAHAGAVCCRGEAARY